MTTLPHDFRDAEARGTDEKLPVSETHVQKFAVYPREGDFLMESTHYEENQDLAITLKKGGDAEAINATEGVVLIELNPDNEPQVIVQVEAPGHLANAHLKALDKAIHHLTIARDRLDRLEHSRHRELSAFGWGREAGKVGL